MFTKTKYDMYNAFIITLPITDIGMKRLQYRLFTKVCAECLKLMYTHETQKVSPIVHK